MPYEAMTHYEGFIMRGVEIAAALDFKSGPF